MQTLIAIATFLVLAGRVVFGVSRRCNTAKLEHSGELKAFAANVQLPIAAALVSEGATYPVTFKALAIADPWDGSASTTTALTEEVPD